MRHLKAGRKFGRNPSSRRAMFRNLTANLITHERIETTDAKAKELRRVAEKLITKAVRLGEVAYEKPSDSSDRTRIAKRLHVARQIGAFIPRFGTAIDEDGDAVQVDLIEKVLIDLAKRYQHRPGGYTRITKLGPRRGDNAPMSIIELIDEEMEPKAPVAEPSEPAVVEPPAEVEAEVVAVEAPVEDVPVATEEPVAAEEPNQ